ncbi:uncharacterized protein LOC111829680 [Capsella rubella]|uniref:uncharacterized protein LOC111829680 n=1 Tax=Capsella rubella TaxID=81985 RepID=UPI000CD56E91|nr:uncharacterized protein LOC111829680 [Capsella rubella]
MSSNFQPPYQLPKTIDDKGVLSKRGDVDEACEKMHLAISLSRTKLLDSVLDEFRMAYLSLSLEDRKVLLLVLAREYYIDRTHVRELIDHYIKLKIISQTESPTPGLDGPLNRIRWSLGHALRPTYAVLFERLKRSNEGPKFLCILSAYLS